MYICMYIMCVYIYIYICRSRLGNVELQRAARRPLRSTANLRTKIPDFREFDSSRILISKGEILMSMENFPECLSQQILVGIILVGRFI